MGSDEFQREGGRGSGGQLLQVLLLHWHIDVSIGASRERARDDDVMLFYT